MSGFFATIQVVLQRPAAGGRMMCETFSAIAAPNPALVVVTGAGGAQAHTDATRAAAALSRSLRDLSAAPSPPAAPCGTTSVGPVGCHAHSEPTCRRVLVVVGDASPMADPFGAIAHWTNKIARGDNRFIVIPALPAGLRSTAPQSLPTSLSAIDIHFWERTPAEIAPRALSAAGITPADSRVFVSYRHGEGQAVAEQLFDRLTHEHFDVFLDRFRIDAGNNFQERIHEELVSKSMVLVLETPTITQSTWVGREVAYVTAGWR